jgi:transporter family protein
LLDLLHPNLLALIAAVLIAAARTLYQGAMTRFGAGLTATLSSIITLQFAWGFYFFSGRVDVWPLRGVLWFMVVGVLGGLAGRYLSFYSMKTVGLARASILLQTSVIWSSTLAILFLGEHMSVLVGLGTLTIMIGAILLVYKGGKEQKEVSPTLYLVPLAAAVFQGMSHLFRKFGFFWISSAPLGMSIGNTVAVISLIAVLPFTKEKVPVSWERRPLLMIFLGAVFNALAALCFWSAVQRGDLVLIIPINRLSILMMIFASWLFFRKQEAITWRVIAGGVLSVAGAGAIALG